MAVDVLARSYFNFLIKGLIKVPFGGFSRLYFDQLLDLFRELESTLMSLKLPLLNHVAGRIRMLKLMLGTSYVRYNALT